MKLRYLLIGFVVLMTAAFAGGLVTADGPIEGREGRAEVRFLEGMIDHHQMALDMANDCLSKASTETITTLCQNIIDAQSAEIATMQEWLLAWYNIDYKPMAMADMAAMMGDMEGMDHGNMEGMPMTDPAMMMGMMAGMSHLEGTEYEVAWLESMVDHHDDAIHMSERILERVPEGDGHAPLRELAEQIIADQTAEIEHMETLITEISSQ